MSKFDIKYFPPEAIRYIVEPKVADFGVVSGKMYPINPAGATMNIQLPAPSPSFHCIIKDVSGDLLNKTVTIVRNGSEKIDNQTANKLVQSDYESLTIFSDGVDWYII